MPAEAEAIYQATHWSVSAEPGAALDQLRCCILPRAGTKHSFSCPRSQADFLERESTQRKSLRVSVYRPKAKVCQAPVLARKPWEIPSLAGCSGPAARTRACSQGSRRGACKILTEQLRSSGNAPNSSDGRWRQLSWFFLILERVLGSKDTTQGENSGSVLV